MNIQQLRLVHETVRNQFNLTRASAALNTSQSGASKHIRDFESELGIDVFERKGKRLLGLTDEGEMLIELIERIVLDLENLRRSAAQLVNEEEGQLTIATTHSQARYVLPQVIREFKQAFPRVHLELHQCSPDEIVALLKAGKVDIGIATEGLGEQRRHLACFKFYAWHHAVVVPDGHPLADGNPLTLERIANYPLITYHRRFTGRSRLNRVFEEAGIAPDLVLTALDADVIKTYVEVGLGVGLIASTAYDKARDIGLTLLPAEHLFPVNTSYIALRRGYFLRDYAYRFLNICRADLTMQTVRSLLDKQAA